MTLKPNSSRKRKLLLVLFGVIFGLLMTTNNDISDNMRSLKKTDQIAADADLCQ